MKVGSKDHIYRMVIVEGCCTMARSSSFRSKLFIGWRKSIVSSDWSDTMVCFGQILLYLHFYHPLYNPWFLQIILILKDSKQKIFVFQEQEKLCWRSSWAWFRPQQESFKPQFQLWISPVWTLFIQGEHSCASSFTGNSIIAQLKLNLHFEGNVQQISNMLWWSNFLF